MGTTILKALLLTISVVSILTLGARSQIAKSSQSFAENTKFLKNSVANENETDQSDDQIEIEFTITDSTEADELNSSTAASEGSETPAVKESGPEMFDPHLPDQGDYWYAFDSTTNTIVIAKSERTEAAINGVKEDEYPVPALRALTYKNGDIEIDVTETGFRGIPGVSVGPAEVFDEKCIVKAFESNSPCELTSKVNGVTTIIEVFDIDSDPPPEWPISRITIQDADNPGQKEITDWGPHMNSPIDINRDGYPDYWQTVQTHTSGAHDFSFSYSVTENGKLIGYRSVSYSVPGC